MATNPSTLPENSGRITAADAAYPFGSAKDDSTGTTGDGTPIKKALLNDTYGIIQAALQAAGTTPSGAAETATESQVLQAINGLASGLANNYTDTGAADAYVLELKANQQKQPSLFDGLVVSFTVANANTGASTVDVSNILGQSPGTTVKNIVDQSGALIPGQLFGRVVAYYDQSADNFKVSDVGADGRTLSGSNGFIALKSGLIIQFKFHNFTAANTYFDVPTSIPFPNGNFGVYGGVFLSSGTTPTASVTRATGAAGGDTLSTVRVRSNSTGTSALLIIGY